MLAEREHARGDHIGADKGLDHVRRGGVGLVGMEHAQERDATCELGVVVGGAHAVEDGVEVVARVEADPEVEGALRLGVETVEVRAEDVAQRRETAVGGREGIRPAR